MIEKINAIRKAIECECYLPALALALTLPDICGQIESGQKGRKQYVDWYDKYVKSLYYVDDCDIATHQFDGQLCYALRCSLLHEGNFELKDREGKLLVDKFKLHIDKVYGQSNIHSSYHEEYGKKIVDLDAYSLCYLICYAARSFYDSYDDKTVFQKYDSVIIDESWPDETYDSLFKS